LVSENELIQKAQNGDVAAFEQLVENYQTDVYNLALKMTGNQDDAFDVAQEAFIKVYLNLPKFKGNSKFSTWVHRIATNACVDEIKKLNKVKTFSMSENVELDDGEVMRDYEDFSANVEANFERGEQLKLVNKAIAALPENHRMVLAMRDVNNMSYEDIAAALKCSEGTVKSRLSRARETLYNVLKKDGLFEE